MQIHQNQTYWSAEKSHGLLQWSSDQTWLYVDICGRLTGGFCFLQVDWLSCHPPTTFLWFQNASKLSHPNVHQTKHESKTVSMKSPVSQKCSSWCILAQRHDLYNKAHICDGMPLMCMSVSFTTLNVSRHKEELPKTVRKLNYNNPTQFFVLWLLSFAFCICRVKYWEFYLLNFTLHNLRDLSEIFVSWITKVTLKKQTIKVQGGGTSDIMRDRRLMHCEKTRCIH